MSMFDNIKFPFLTHQQLNLDWILNEIKRVMGFFPESGDPGTVLMKTEDGASWEELAAVDININGVPEDTELTDTDKLIFYDVSSSANRKITAPNLLNSMMSNGVPLMDGTGSAGTSKKPARYDHRHPTDTSRAPADYFQNGNLKFEHGGLNDSGSKYCKMPDGTLICWGFFTTNRDQFTLAQYGALYGAIADLDISYAQEFSSTPVVSILSIDNSCPVMYCIAGRAKLTKFEVERHVNSAPPDGATWNYIAIGRWK